MVDRNEDGNEDSDDAGTSTRTLNRDCNRRDRRTKMQRHTSLYLSVLFLFAGSTSTSTSTSISIVQAQTQGDTSGTSTSAPPAEQPITATGAATTTATGAATTTPQAKIPSTAPVIAPVPFPVPTPTNTNTTVPSTPAIPTIWTAPPLNAQLLTPFPSTSNRPSAGPSPIPTGKPSVIPTISQQPSASPTTSALPTISSWPTANPSTLPTGQPSWIIPSLKYNKFRQNLTVLNGRKFTEDEVVFFQTVYRVSTKEFAPIPEEELDKITITCEVELQKLHDDLPKGEDRRLLNDDPNSNNDESSDVVFLDYDFGNDDDDYDDNANANAIANANDNSYANTGGFNDSVVTPQRIRGLRRRRAEEISDNVTLSVYFKMEYESHYYNVTQYPKLFQNWTNSNLNEILFQMQALKMEVSAVEKAERIVEKTSAPSMSPEPSSVPTQYPTISVQPTANYTPVPAEIIPQLEPDGVDQVSIIAISASVVIALAILIVGVFFWCRKQRTNSGMDQQANKSERHGGVQSSMMMNSDQKWTSSTAAMSTNLQQLGGTSESKAYGPAFRKQQQHSGAPSRLSGMGVAVSPNGGSLHSNPSMVSEGHPIGDDSGDDEADTTQILADEFDQYQDQNLEKMRADVEGNLEGCDGMMSQAVARALIDDVDYNTSAETYWGGDFNISAPQIEASALGSVMDWLKRNSKASDRQKREFFQDTLNKMTGSVRYGVLGPEDGARAIHECAGLLGLQLAVEIPVTTIVISGMRKSTTEDDIRNTFSAFGDIALAAVAPMQKGYGILRFTSDVAVERVMNRFRIEEIVLDDVAVQLRVIKPGSRAEADGMI